MKSYGDLELAEGSDFINLTVSSGSVLPTTTPNIGELFYKTNTAPGLYVYTGSAWYNLSSGVSSTVVSYVFTKAEASNIWTITHNLNTLNVTYSFTVLIDSTPTQIVPKTLIVVDANTISVSFNQSYAGSATIIGSTA